MQPNEVTDDDLHCLFTTQTSNFSIDTLTHDQFRTFSNPFDQLLQMTAQLQESNNPQPIYFSSNSVSDDQADDQQKSELNERKRRRMISNRESARRARLKKKNHLDELWSQVVWLRNENFQLINKLNGVSEDRERALQENARLKDEARELRQMLCDALLGSPYHRSRESDDDLFNN